MTRDFCDKLDTRRVAVKIAPSPTKDRVTIHAKYVLVDGSYGGGVDQRITWMGSHNFTDNALQRNDETFVQFRRRHGVDCRFQATGTACGTTRR